MFNGSGLNEENVLRSTSSGAVKYVLPSVTEAGKVVRVKKTSIDNNALTIQSSDSAKIDGESTKMLTLPYENVILVSDGQNWFIMN